MKRSILLCIISLFILNDAFPQEGCLISIEGNELFRTRTIYERDDESFVLVGNTFLYVLDPTNQFIQKDIEFYPFRLVTENNYVGLSRDENGYCWIYDRDFNLMHEIFIGDTHIYVFMLVYDEESFLMVRPLDGETYIERYSFTGGKLNEVRVTGGWFDTHVEILQDKSMVVITRIDDRIRVINSDFQIESTNEMDPIPFPSELTITSSDRIYFATNNHLQELDRNGNVLQQISLPNLINKNYYINELESNKDKIGLVMSSFIESSDSIKLICTDESLENFQIHLFNEVERDIYARSNLIANNVGGFSFLHNVDIDKFGITSTDSLCEYQFCENLVLSSSIENELPTGIKVYPNPSTNFLIIDSKETIAYKRMYDFEGKRIQLYMSSDRMVEIDHLQEGLYFLEIGTKDGNHEIIKFIKQED